MARPLVPPGQRRAVKNRTTCFIKYTLQKLAAPAAPDAV
jgi:hypothetical protein